MDDPDHDAESSSPKEQTVEAMGAAAIARRPSQMLPTVSRPSKPPSGEPPDPQAAAAQ